MVILWWIEPIYNFYTSSIKYVYITRVPFSIKIQTSFGFKIVLIFLNFQIESY